MDMKKSAVSLLIAMAALPARPADTVSPDVDHLVTCAAIKDPAKRLACLDQEMAPVVDARGAPNPKTPPAPPAAKNQVPPAATPAAPAAAPNPAPSPDETAFGAELLNPDARPGPATATQVLHAHIAKLGSAGTGMFLVFLDNGTVWRHEDSVQGDFLTAGEAITITKAKLGSYRLSRDAGLAKNWIRVTRVR